MCFYLHVILLISFSCNPLGSCSLCSILRIPMQKLGSHPECMLQSKHTEPTEHHSLWEGHNTRLSGDSELKSLRAKALEHEGQQALPVAKTHPYGTHHHSFTTVLVTDCYQAQAAPSEVTRAFNMICKEGGQQNKFCFSLTGMLPVVGTMRITKKGPTLLIRSKVQV